MGGSIRVEELIPSNVLPDQTITEINSTIRGDIQILASFENIYSLT